MAKQTVSWECASCGFLQSKWTGCCTSCGSWNSFVEKAMQKKSLKRFESEKDSFSKPMKLSEIKIGDHKRIKSNISEIDRLLGSGVVPGALTLIAGEPGIGKSTLLLQLSEGFAKSGLKVLYVSGEESLEQSFLRAKRLKVESDNLYLLSETSFSAIKAEIDNVKPHVIIVDSVQILYKEEIQSAPGSIVQVREIAGEFMRIAKGFGITTFLVGHVTKSGDIAGPRVLEHIVDTVLEFEGDKRNGYRLLRSIKNRFGSTDDIAAFQMKEDGLKQVENLSKAFLRERIEKMAGSVVVPTTEGSRSILVEVQALVTHSVFPSPSRKCTGLDQNRLALLLAVLEKKLGYKLYTSDVFVSIAGGMKIFEPAIDLGILVAIASSFSNRMICFDTAVFGEVGLGGEVRGVSRLDVRIKELVNMGFKRCIIPKINLKDVSKETKDFIEIVGVGNVNEAVGALL